MRIGLAPLSLSRRIVASVALGLGVTLVVFALVVLWTIHDSAEAAYGERVTLAQTLGTRVDDVLRYALVSLEREAADLTIETGRPLTEAQRRRLADLRFRVGSFAILSVTDAEGMASWTDPSESEVALGSPLYHPSLRRVLQTGEPQITELPSLVDPATVFACLAVPLRDSSGRVAGVLMAELDPHHPALNLLPSGAVGDAIFVQLMNDAGRLLAGTAGFSPAMAMQHRALLADLIAARAPGYRIHGERPDSRVASHIVAYTPLSQLPSWGVVLEQPSDVILALPRRLQQRLVFLGLAVLPLAMAAAWLGARRVVRPLKHLTAAAERFAGGKLEEPVSLDRADELGMLARAFEAMRQQLTRSRVQIETHNRELEQRVEARTKEIEERNRQLASANAIASTVSSSLKAEEILARAMERVLEVTGLEHGRFRLLPGGANCQGQADRDFVASPLVSTICSAACLCGRSAKLSVSLVARDIHAEPEAVVCQEAGLKSVVAVPLSAQEQVLGVLFLGSAGERSFEQRDIDTLSAIGRQIGMALANARLYEEVQEREQARVRLIEQIISAQEGERKRMARDLHDSTGQALSAVIVGLQAMEEIDALDAVRLAKRLLSTRELAEAALADLRGIVLDLRPIVLDDLGLIPAIRAYAEQHLGERGVRVHFVATGLKERLPARLETCLFRALQEAITNVAKHARANAVRVQLARANAHVTALVQDDGVGFNPTAVHHPSHSGEGLGLLGMRERIELLGGSVRVASSPGSGTRIEIVAPLAASNLALL